MFEAPKWYDSLWLEKYLAAKDVLARVAPERSEEFVRRFDPLRTDRGFAPRKFERLIAPDELEDLRQAVRSIPKEWLEFHELERLGRLIVHDYPAFAELHENFAARVSEWAGEAVEPAYSFLSMYMRKGVCEPHLDAPSAKWTLDICIGQSEPWPIRFSRTVPWPEDRITLHGDWRAQLKSLDGLNYQAETLLPGDAVLFSGSSQWHYRDAMPDRSTKSFCDLLLLHYIPKGTAELVEPKNWADMFGIPEFALIPGIERDELSARRAMPVGITRR